MIETQSVVLHEHHSEIRRKYVLLSLSHTARLAPFPDLLTTYTFVKQSGGHVTIETEGGSGATINFFLPQARIRLPA